MRPLLYILATTFFVVAALEALPWIVEDYWDFTAYLACGMPALCGTLALAASRLWPDGHDYRIK